MFAIIGGAFVPLNFLAVRLAESLIHPRVLSTTGGAMPGEMRMTFRISLVAIVACRDAVEYDSPPTRLDAAARAEARSRRRRRGPARARPPRPTLI